MAQRVVAVLDVAVKVVLIGLLAHAVLNPELAQYQGKAMAGRALTFPLAAFAVPILWWVAGRGHAHPSDRARPFPFLVDLLVTAPFLIDVAGNALDLYDSIEWWDDLNHFMNWGLLTAAVAITLSWTRLDALPRFGLAVGFAAVSAIGWELAEYVTFIRFSDELATAYTDTLGDLTLGTLGGALGAAAVELVLGTDGGQARVSSRASPP
jgi:hypothetical protein